MPPRLKINKWDKFNYYTIIKELEQKGRLRVFKCQCICGEIKKVRLDTLRSKKDSSCGCIKKTKQSKPRTHWLTWTGIQRSYYHLKDRCENPDNKRYYDYWGRGIKNLWNSFEAFVNDMRGTWQEWLQIDRIDNNWHYCKENCKWSNRKEQMNNKRNNVIIKYNWKKLTLTQWGRELNIPYKRLEARYRRGWSIDRLFIN